MKETFLQAIKSGDLSKVEALLKNAPELASQNNESGVSVLLMAIYQGQAEIAEAIHTHHPGPNIWESAALGDLPRLTHLVEEDPALVDAYAPDGFTPLGLAAFFGRVDVLEFLLGEGADPDKVARNNMRVAPIHSAAAHRNPPAALEMVAALLECGAQVNVAQLGGWTPLHQAASHGHLELVQHLLHHGADPSNRSDDGRTPADMARENGHTGLLDLLEPHSGS